MFEQIQHWIAEYGYLTILVWTFIEGETVVIVAGVIAKLGQLELPYVILAAFVGSLCGDQFYFFIGRFQGKKLLDRHPKWSKRVEWINRHLERHRDFLVLTFRFYYGIRNVTPFVIGASDIPTLRFFVLNTIGAAVWATSFAGAGYAFGHAMEAFMGNMHHAQLYILGTVVALAFIAWVVMRLRRRAREAREAREGANL
ncbi:membrane protein DedA with SNARE-associated domain [Plasticicumulans lactativorans]|uniref:Membrane protein DedA with SNARE-associated domain n=1 Tax=Plasticicumulans lactativorans TaxID=1133106 RepID=A0A4R2L8L7_9GAMM|nr:DedA family protein [Plasticicumulans lactativorans]TCO82412.1 membrane protein DedA with SNARE-associated domain [Plasticicumulans lactativorans]